MQRGVRVCMCIVQGYACVPACVVQRGVYVHCARLCMCACMCCAERCVCMCKVVRVCLQGGVCV